MSTRRLTTMTMNTKALYSIFLLLPKALCHMEMSWPYPLHSKYNPDNTYQNIDYSMTNPLRSDGSNYPCKGYQNDGPIQPVITYTAGSQYNMTLSGSAIHRGGSCQISLSYDNGATFRVIKSMIGGCPLKSTYDFTVPAYAPAGEALLAWTWQNYEGNREYYMNCAAVSISSATTPRRRQGRRQLHTRFDSLPEIFKANLDGVTECVTKERESPVYSDPGPDVEYGAGMSSSDPPTDAECNSPQSYGQHHNGQAHDSPHDAHGASSAAPSAAAYVVTKEVELAPAVSTPVGETTPSASSISDYGRAGHGGLHDSYDADSPFTSYMIPDTDTSGPSATDESHDDSDSLATSAISLQQNRVAAETSPSGSSTSTTTVTMTMDCPETGLVTITMPPSTTTTTLAPSPSFYTTSVPAAACTGTAATCPCASGYSCQSIGVCAWQCQLSSPTAPSSPSTLSPTTYPGDISPTPSSTPPPPPPPRPTSTSTNRPPYATDDLTRYLPCVPGTFLCTSATSFNTCNYPADGSGSPSPDWEYGYPRAVAEGMECLPSLSPYSEAAPQQQGQQGQTPRGYYRDDRYVRARPEGDCDEDGAVRCTDEGRQFSVCDQGGWVGMGAVAAGTRCWEGRIVAA